MSNRLKTSEKFILNLLGDNSYNFSKILAAILAHTFIGTLSFNSIILTCDHVNKNQIYADIKVIKKLVPKL